MRYSKIFLIDDDEDDQELFLMALEEIAPTVKCTVHSDGKQALLSLSDPLHVPDVIFLDLNMPVMTGQQFMAALTLQRAEQRKIPIIVLSTSSDKKSIEDTKLLGVEIFITKPNNFNDLKHILKQILD